MMFQPKPFLALLLTAPYFGYLLTNNIHERPALGAKHISK